MSVFDLSNRVAIITGGGGTEHGIGKSVALAFAEAGATVVIAGRNATHLEAVSDLLRDNGAPTLAVVCDVTDPAQCAELVSATTREFGKLDILVNNAGIVHMGDPLELTPEQWRESIDVNLNGTFFASQAAARQMVSQHGGRIVNLASSSGIKGDEFMAPYAASKAAVINLTRTLAISWAIHDIGVNCVAPGRVLLPDHDLTGVPSQELEQRGKMENPDGNPIQQPGAPEDIADAVLFFASEGAAGMTGETLMVRGAEWASAYS